MHHRRFRPVFIHTMMRSESSAISVGPHPSCVTVISAGLPSGVQEVVLTVPGGRRVRSSIRALSVTGTNFQYTSAGSPFNLGITDNAGNPLQGFSQSLLSFARGRTGGGAHVKVRTVSLRGHGS